MGTENIFMLKKFAIYEEFIDKKIIDVPLVFAKGELQDDLWQF